MITTTSEKLAAFICCREALVTVAYEDGPNLSIGFGSNSPDLKPGDTITIQDAFLRLKKDIALREPILANLIKVNLQQNQFDAIFDLLYQNGNKNNGTNNVTSLINTLSASQLSKTFDPVLQRVANGDVMDVVSAEFQKYDLNSSGQSLPGLLMRRNMEVDMFWRGDYGDLSSILVFNGNPHQVKPTSMSFDYTDFS